MGKKKSKMFPRKPTEEEIKKWRNDILIEGVELNEVPADIRTYIAILLGV